MTEGDFQYKPLNSTTRPAKRRLPKLPKIGKLGNFKFPKFNFKKGQKWDAKRIAIWVGLGIAGMFLAGVVVLAILIAVISIGLPSVHDLDKLYVAQSTTIYDREGNVLYVKYGGENRKYVPFDQISQDVINATIAIEDDQYWEHSGFDLIGIGRAFVNNIVGGSQQGGSTLTQQYIKNAFLSSEKTYTRKLKELILAVQLEQAYSKEEILELYLNKIPYGNNAFGVEKAAEVYFDKASKDLTLAEAAILASLPKAPSYYNPYGPHKYSELTTTIERNVKSEAELKDNEFLRGLIGKNVALNEESTVYVQGRTDLVLKAMEKLDYITESEKKDALQELQGLEFEKHKEKMYAPHFVFYVLDELEEKYGKEIVEQGGLQVYTTIDPTLQEYAETAIEEGVATMTEKYNAHNGALTSIDPKTGQILAMVGSADYFNEEIDGAVNIATSYKQPGSSFKPIVYAKSFYNRYAPASIMFDVKTRFGASNYPDNYDGKFLGPMSIRKALGQSRNITAIKAYFLADEQEGVIDLAEKMGINFLDPDHDYGWSLALGTGEVRQLDMTSAFGAFANNGIRHEPLAIMKVENAQGEVLEEWKETEGEEVIDPQIAYLITDILSDESVNLGPLLTVPGHKVAAKTGTSNKRKGTLIYPSDLWTIGYSPDLVTAVWIGNTKETEDTRLGLTASGYTAATPIWNNYMKNALSDKPASDFEVPEGLERVKVSKLTGKLPGPNTPDHLIVEEVFTSFSVPTEVDDSYSIVKIDSRNNKLANEFCPEKFTKEMGFIELHAIAPFPTWEEGVMEWMEQKAAELFSGVECTGEEGEECETKDLGDILIGIAPTSTSELCTEENLEDKPEITIKSPKDEAEIEIGSTLKINVKIKAPNGIEKVEYYLDDQYKYSTSDAPYTGTIRLPKGEEGSNIHLITVKAIDDFGYSSEESIQIITTEEDDEDEDEPDKDEDKDDKKDEEDPPPEPDDEPDEDELPPPDEEPGPEPDPEETPEEEIPVEEPSEDPIEEPTI
jgi:membrane peptidoglycan carboxypeptidase